MSFPLERTGDSSYDTWVQYRTQDGTAAAGADYEAASGSVLIPAGATEATIPVQALGASSYSSDKQFTLEFGVAGVGPTPAFAAPQAFATGEGSNSVVSTDLNGDGRADLLVTNGGDDTFSALLNTTAPGASTPSFAAEQTFAAGRGPGPGPSADVNGDGRPDLIVTNSQFDEHAVSVFLNTTDLGSSTASFAARQIVATGDSPRQVTAADLNGDGRPDLVFSNTGRAYVSVLMNTTAPGSASASFAPKQDFATGQNSNSLKATDINGDGRRDLVVATGVDDCVSVLLNTMAPGASTPSFAPHQCFPVQGINPRSVATADINDDGRPDLIVASQGIPWVSVLLNTTAPGATTPSFAPQQVVPNLPSGFKESVTAADLNGDGKPDLVVTNFGGAIVSVLFNTTPAGAGTASFSTPQNIKSAEFETLWWVTTTDVNGDGRPDLIVANNTVDGKVSVLLNATVAPMAAAPSFAAEQSFAAGDAPSAVGSADLNGDGRPDLLVANEGEDTASVLLNTTAPGATTPSFAAEQSFATGDAPSAVGSTDLIGDGKPDLIAANEGEDTASVLLNTTAPGATTPSFAAEQSFATGDAPSAVGSTDLNGDGSPDLIAGDRGANAVSVLLNAQYMASVTPASVTGTIHYTIPQVSLSPAPLAFGEELIGSSTSETAILSNTGGEELTVEGIAIGGPDADEFSQANTCPPTLDVDSSCSIDVTYTPNAAGAASATLITTSNAPTSPDTVALSGTGYTSVPPPPPPVPTRALSVSLTGGGEGRVEDGTGAIACPSVCTHSYVVGAQVRLAAQSVLGSRFIGWSGGGCSGTGGCHLTIDADTTLTAQFAKVPPLRSRLRIGRVQSRSARAKMKIVVGGRITKRARGAVKVKVSTKLRGRRLVASKRAQIRDGRWQTRLVLPGLDGGSSAPISITAHFQGSPGVRSGSAKRRIGL
ncbi:MAG TPA: FG-GAP-like repeat-containing protein [Solirubrobacterales bacterium]|nr:FG-GAP-like repeat-containing protein [Solirubrobacterales bacterium]